MASVNPTRMQRFAQNVMGEQTLEGAIEKLQVFYQAMKMPSKLSEFGLTEEALKACAESACARTGTIGQFKKLTSEDVLAIYRSVF